MSSYVRMYAVPKEKYDAFLAGSCKGDIKYTRQINQLDVNDGGKVIIRNDDNIKKTTAPSNQQKIPTPSPPPPPEETFPKPNNTFRKSSTEDRNYDSSTTSPGKDASSSDSSEINDDFWTDFNERLRKLREGLPSERESLADFNERLRKLREGLPSERESLDDFNERIRKIREGLRSERGGSSQAPDDFQAEQSFPSSGEGQNLNFPAKKNSSPEIQNNFPPRNENQTSNSLPQRDKSPPARKKGVKNSPHQSLPMLVTSENPPRVFTRMSELNSSGVNPDRYPLLAQAINSIQMDSELPEMDVNVNLNALPEDFFNSSQIRDYDDVINLLDWKSSTNNLNGDVFDAPMDTTETPLTTSSKKMKNELKATRRGDRRKSMKNRSVFGALHARKPIHRRLAFLRENASNVSTPLNEVQSVTSSSNSLLQMEISPVYRNRILNSQANDSMINNMGKVSENMVGERKIASIKLPSSWQSTFKKTRLSKKPFPDRQAEREVKRALRMQRQAGINERRGPRRIPLFDDSDSDSSAEGMTKSSGEGRKVEMTSKNEGVEGTTGSSRETRLKNRSKTKNDGTEMSKAESTTPLRVKIGKPQEDIISIVRKKPTLRKRDHSPEMSVVFTKNKLPEKKKKEESEDDDDDDYKMWSI